MNDRARNDRALTLLIADPFPLRRRAIRSLLEGGAPDVWTPRARIEVVAEAGTFEEALRLASELAPDVAVVEPLIGRRQEATPLTDELVRALRRAGVGRVVLYGGQEELSDEDMERIRAAFGADAALLASGDPAELGDAVVGQTVPR